jgi:flagellar hook-basal body complex protein FliE
MLAPTAVQQPAAGFEQWFAQEVGAVNTSIVNSENDIKKLATGETQSLHEVMIHMEEAKLSFQLLAQVRNRLLDAYQEVMRMQV